MYYIEMGLGKKWKPLAVAFALFGIMTAMLGSGTTTQMNAIVSSVQAGFGVSTYITCAASSPFPKPPPKSYRPWR